MNTTHYPSLALCQRLSELGWTRETEKSWEDLGHRQRIADTFEGSLCPAPSVAEMLDVAVEKARVEFCLFATLALPYRNIEAPVFTPSNSMSRADQLATCLINLAERGEITL
ncbi:MAG: hypothetical protein M0R06_25065 [Sphaerochaeta sp.]|jgi:hypothetical protein|nr:hypothetical protein [Sphaerochaeta sp.]